MIDRDDLISIITKYIPDISIGILSQITDEICALGIHEPASARPFLDSLTKSEQKALDCILNLINYTEGTLVISKLIEQSQVSRAVITNLIVKIEKYRVMEVKSKGVKGTYFKTLTNFKENF